MTTAEPSWQDINQKHIVAHLDRLRSLLRAHAAARSGDPAAAREQAADPPACSAQDERGAPPALDVLCHLFRLSPFERDILVLAAGVELASDFAGLCASAQGDPART